MPRALVLRHLDALHCKDSDRVLAQALGLVLSGALILGWVALKLTPKRIGA